MIRYALPLCLLLAASCDSGDIYPEQRHPEEVQMNIHATFRFANTGAFPQNYRIVWGAFTGTSPYPLAFETVAPAGDTWNATPLQTVPRGADRMALALAEKNENKTRYVFREFRIDNTVPDMNIAETVDLATFSRIQAQVFTPQCIQCHGAGGMAAGLNLTEGNAYGQLAGVPANADNSDKYRVAKHSIRNSFLIDVLTSRPETVTTNHTTLSTLDAADDVALISAWIMSGNTE
ncbi:MAG: hypothetical protein LBV26_06680 [Bacteroidales bacterium]|jgi:hypothetical protein|nr:hypothetical protein [Bacteroidales bacterium]